MTFELRSGKQFFAFLLSFIAAGAAWLWASAKVINRIMRGRR